MSQSSQFNFNPKNQNHNQNQKNQIYKLSYNENIEEIQNSIISDDDEVNLDFLDENPNIDFDAATSTNEPTNENSFLSNHENCFIDDDLVDMVVKTPREIPSMQVENNYEKMCFKNRN